MLENGEPIAVVNPKVKHLMTKRSIDNVPTCSFQGAIDRTNNDHWIWRTAIRRGSPGEYYYVVRYNGHYHQVMGGIRTPFFLSEIKCGKY